MHGPLHQPVQDLGVFDGYLRRTLRRVTVILRAGLLAPSGACVRLSCGLHRDGRNYAACPPVGRRPWSSFEAHPANGWYQICSGRC